MLGIISDSSLVYQFLKNKILTCFHFLFCFKKDIDFLYKITLNRFFPDF